MIGYVILRKYGPPYRRVWSACFVTVLPPQCVDYAPNAVARRANLLLESISTLSSL
jgi:hypothetical protein